MMLELIRTWIRDYRLTKLGSLREEQDSYRIMVQGCHLEIRRLQLRASAYEISRQEAESATRNLRRRIKSYERTLRNIAAEKDLLRKKLEA